MTPFKVLPTSFAEEAREISENIALLPHEQWEDVQDKGNKTQKKEGYLYLPGEMTTTFREKLNGSIVRGVQRAVTELMNAKIRKARPDEYQLPPTVLKARAVSQQQPNWLQTSEDEVVIYQTLHKPNQCAKLQIRGKLSKERYTTDLQHGEVIVIVGAVIFLPEPFDSPFLMEKLFAELADR